jgi:hypothetical protein
VIDDLTVGSFGTITRTEWEEARAGADQVHVVLHQPNSQRVGE